MKRSWWKVTAWTVAFVAAVMVWLLAWQFPLKDELAQGVMRTIEMHQYRYVGDLSSGLFHRQTCPSVNSIAKQHRVTLFDRQTAWERGFSPCPRCQP